MHSCQIFCFGTDDGKPEYKVSFPSNWRNNTVTEPEDLDLFCMIVSSAGRFELVEEKVARMKEKANCSNKWQQKMRDKET